MNERQERDGDSAAVRDDDAVRGRVADGHADDRGHAINGRALARDHAADGHAAAQGRTATPALLAALIFLVALNLRPAIVAVGPVLTRIGADMGWGETALGMLGAMPLWMFAAFSPLVRFATTRIGADRTILAALLVLAAGDAVRSFGGPAGIWVGTVAIGAGIAAGNVLVPVIAKRDYAGHVPLATGVYSACITSGSAIAGLTSAALADALGGWRQSLVVWAVPPLVVAALWSVRVHVLARKTRAKGAADVDDGVHGRGVDDAGSDVGVGARAYEVDADIIIGSEDDVHAADGADTGFDASASACTRTDARMANGASAASAPAPVPTASSPTASSPTALAASSSPSPSPSAGHDLPLWRRPTTWWVTLFMGLQSAAFYTMSNWLPSVAASAGFDETQAGVQLFVFQSLGILSGLLISALMRVRGDQVCAALTASMPMVVAGLGWMMAPAWSPAWSVIGGMGQGASLVVALTLISLRGRTPAETVALSGMAQSLGYLIASVGPFAFGALAEASGGWMAPLTLFTALAAVQCAIAVLAGRVRG